MSSSSKVLLAIDTSTRQISLALYNGILVLGECTWSSYDYHTVELAPAVEGLFQSCHTQISELGAIAVASGPGSFTGLRIGMALAKGLSLALHIPLIGIPTLDILVAAQPVTNMLLVAVLRAGRSNLAVGRYQVNEGDWKSLGDVEVLTAEELKHQIRSPTILCGEMTVEEMDLFSDNSKYVKLATPAQSLRRASYLAEIGWQRWQAGQIDDPSTLSPWYLHYNEPIST
jgi:tRNA threonylcarbamoyladenosine biosynthesis protein TsaB